MGYGLLYQQLRSMEGAKGDIILKNKKPLKNVRILSANLERGVGLYVMLDLGNGRHMLLTPEHRIKEVKFKPVPVENGDSYRKDYKIDREDLGDMAERP